MSLVKLTSGDLRRYSLTRAVAAAEPRDRMQCFESEISDQLKATCQRAGFSIGGGPGLLVPLAAITGDLQEPLGLTFGRAMTPIVSSAGGYLVGDRVTPPAPLLRPASALAALGATLIEGETASGNWGFPRALTGSVLQWLAEGATGGNSDLTLATTRITPRRLEGGLAVSRDLLNNGVGIDAFLRNDLLAACGEALDRGGLLGSGVQGEPTGILNMPGINTVTFGGAATWTKVVSFERALANVQVAPAGWIVSPETQEKWKTNPKFSEFPSFLMNEAGTVNGKPSIASTHLAASNRVIQGDFSKLVIVLWPVVQIISDQYSRKREGIHEFYVRLLADIGPRYPQAFAVSTDSGAQ